VERMTFELFVRVKQDQNVLAAAREMAAPSSSDGPTVLVAALFTSYPLPSAPKLACLPSHLRASPKPQTANDSSESQPPCIPQTANDSSKSQPPCIPVNFRNACLCPLLLFPRDA
jgi:hypothetical protein